MTYNTPHLLLVGAAQNLVLLGEDSSAVLGTCGLTDEDPGPHVENSDKLEEW
jgi:hypothetical protein